MVVVIGGAKLVIVAIEGAPEERVVVRVDMLPEEVVVIVLVNMF